MPRLTAIARPGILAAFVTFMAFGGCRGGDLTSPLTALADAEARQRWADRGPRAYSVELDRDCFCQDETTLPVIITVVDGAVVSRVYKANGARVAAEHASMFPAIEDLFDFINGLRGAGHERVAVRYDRVYGYPARIEIDHCLKCLDDGALYTLENLQPVLESAVALGPS